MFCLEKYAHEPKRARPRKRADRAILAVAFSTNHKYLASATVTGLSVWDLAQKNLLIEFPLVAAGERLNCLAFCHGNNLVIAGGSTDLHVFDLQTRAHSQHARRSECLTMDVCDSLLGVYGLFNSMLEFFHQADPARVLFRIRDVGPVCCVSLNQSGTLAVSCTNKPFFSVWDLATHALLHRIAQETWVWAAICNEAGDAFISCEGRHACKLQLWKKSAAAASIELKGELFNTAGREQRFESYAVSRDFSRVLFACQNGVLAQLELDTGAWSIVHEFPVGIQDISFAAARNSSLCAAGLADGAIWAIDLARQDKERVFALLCACHDRAPSDIFRIIRQLLCWNNNAWA